MLIVAYHAIGTPPSRIVTPLHWLRDDLCALVDAGYRMVSLDACADWIAGRLILPPCSAVLTFDDGYASVLASAVPVLQRMEIPATLFVVAGRIGSDNHWPGQPASVPRLPLVDTHMLSDLVAARVDIGSHTWSHPRLTSLDDAMLDDEVVGAADRLEQVAGVAVRHFAYPYGLYGPREVSHARLRFRTALTTIPRLVGSASDPHTLGRIDAHDLHVAARLRLLGSPAILAPYLAARRGLRALVR